MAAATQKESERRRLQILRKLKILDTQEEQIYQDVVALASQICGAPISLVSLVDEERQWFKAKVGVDATETSREVSFCAHAILQSHTFVIEDATEDPRFQDNELVTGAFHLRFYAGSPIYAGNEAVGTVCVIDREPRKISPQQIQALEALARQVSAHFQLRLQNDQLAKREEDLAIALKKAEELAVQFATNEKFVRTIFDASPGLIAYLDTELRFRFANTSYVKWFGRTIDQVIGAHMRDLQGDQLYAANEFHLHSALAGKLQQFERTTQKGNGTIKHMLAHYIPDVRPDGVVRGIFVLVSDITDLKEKELQLRLNASVLEYILEGVMVMDSDGVIVSVNPAFEEITGFSPEEALGLTAREVNADAQRPDFIKEISGELASAGYWEGEVWSRRKNGEAYLQQRMISVVPDCFGQPSRFITVFRDVTARWEQGEQMRRHALYDSVTELPNRYLLLERISQLLSQSDRQSKVIALMFCDLDGLKP